MKHLKSLIITLLLLLIVSGCSQQKTEVGLILYKEKDPFVYNYSLEIESYAEGLYELTTLDSGNSQITQNEQIIEYQETHDADLMIINPVDRLSTYALINKQREIDVPVIFFNREPLQKDLELWEHAYYVGAKAEQSGTLQAELIMDLFGNDPDQLNDFDRNGDGAIQALILKGEPGHQDAEIRTEEVLKAFKSHGFTLDFVIQTAYWDLSTSYEYMERVFREYGEEFEVVLSNNDAMALGAIDRLREYGYFTDTNANGEIDPADETWIPVVGIDGISGAVEMIREGYLYGTVINDSTTQARAVVELSEYILGTRRLEDLSFELVDDSYIWVDYQVFTLE